MADFWTDSHVHLNMLKKRTPFQAIELAKQEEIHRFINIGTNSKDHPIVLDLAKKYDEVYCTLGVHPHDAKDFVDAKSFMLKNLNHPKVVAVGEIGLDFYYDNAPRDLQIKVFNEQMDIAQKFDLPVQIHTRNAEEETIQVLKNYEGRVQSLLHCFSSSRKLAEKGVEYGCHFSLSGIVTFNSADSLRESIQNVIPLDRIHIETDAPFLAPVPKRGEENHSAFMLHTAKKIAQLKGISLKELKTITAKNNLKLFRKLKY